MGKRKKILFVGALYFLYCVFWIFTDDLNYKITSNIIYNLINLSLLPGLLLPLILLWIIKRKTLKILFFLFYGVVFVLITPIILFGTLMVHGDLNNGWRLIYQQTITHETWLSVYRTPDLGALGGDHLAVAIVTPVFPGVVRRIILHQNLIKELDINDSSPIEIWVKDKSLIIPSIQQLYNKDKLE